MGRGPRGPLNCLASQQCSGAENAPLAGLTFSLVTLFASLVPGMSADSAHSSYFSVHEDYVLLVLNSTTDFQPTNIGII